jgi:sodium/hydrogen exchanger-like protein 6/7
MLADVLGPTVDIARRVAEDADPDGEDASQKEIYTSWALFILILLLIAALFTSYMLQQRKVTAIHETVASIFAGSSRRPAPSPTEPPCVLGLMLTAAQVWSSG